MNTIIAYPRWLAEEQLSRSTWDTYLDQKEKPNTRWMKVVERNVTRSICLVPFPLSDKCYTLCNVSNDRWLNFDGLCVKI